MVSRYLRVVMVVAASFGLSAQALAAAAPEAVTNFTQTATLDRTGNIAVDDEINYDFGAAVPHPISYRIPLSYHDDQGQEYRINFALMKADIGGKEIEVSPAVSADTVALTLPSGAGPGTARLYSLRYRLGPVVLSGDSADLFKHSVTGLAWAVPINQATLRFTTTGAQADNVTCYTGEQGSTTGACTYAQSGKTSTVVTTAPLLAGQGLSVLAELPRGSAQIYLTPYDAHPVTLADLVTRGVIGLALFVALVVWLAVWRRRRIVAGRASDYTNANETPKGQAHRK